MPTFSKRSCFSSSVVLFLLAFLLNSNPPRSSTFLFGGFGWFSLPSFGISMSFLTLTTSPNGG